MISWLYVSSQQLQNFIDTFLDYWERFFEKFANPNFSGEPYLLDIVWEVALLAITLLVIGKTVKTIQQMLPMLAA